MCLLIESKHARPSLFGKTIATMTILHIEILPIFHRYIMNDESDITVHKNRRNIMIMGVLYVHVNTRTP